MCGQKIAEYKQNEREYQKRIDDWSEKNNIQTMAIAGGKRG